MTTLRKLIKPPQLQAFLASACAAFEGRVCAAVAVGGEVLAASDGGAPEPRDAGTVRIPIATVDGVAAELWVAAARGGYIGSEKIDAPARFLAETLQVRLDAEEAIRAVSRETLEAYREIALLHRAAVDLNRSLKQSDVAGALLREFSSERDSGRSDAGIVFWRDPSTGGHFALRSFGADEGQNLERIGDSQLIQAVVASGKGEIINDLEGDPRWHGDVPGLTAVLLIPLIAHDFCSGALVLGRFAPGAGFSAADLKRAGTLASVASAALNNARLFEEVVKIKNYSESILQNLSNGVVTLDEARRVTKANAAAERILGCAATDIAGLALDHLFAGANAWASDALAEVISAGTVGEWLDRDLVTGDGKEVSVNLVADRLAAPEKHGAGYILVLEDITRQKRLKGTMVRFMSDKVVERLLEADDSLLGGSAQEVSVLFSDIRDFTSLSEKLTARDTVDILNEYFSDMVDVIFTHGGTLDKFIGDSIMAVFGAPFVAERDPDNAVTTAVEMLHRLRELNRRLAGTDRPVLDVGVGINTGPVVAGTIGSPKRMDYTVIGDHVNVASRIEAANKYYGTKILISEHTLSRLGDSRQLREIDWVRVEGRERPVGLFEVLDYHVEESFPGLEKVIAAYEAGLASYRAGDWKRAIGFFATALEHNPGDRPARLFLERCKLLLRQPRATDWSAVTDLSRTGRPANAAIADHAG